MGELNNNMRSSKHTIFTGNLPNEDWKDVVGYEGIYEVSNLGRIKSLPKQRGVQFIEWSSLLSQKINRYNYLVATISKDNKPKSVHVHQLVAKAFLPNHLNRPCVNHIDGNRQNNKVENLEWVDYFENMKHAVNAGLLKSKGINNSQCRLNESDVLEIFHSKYTAKQLAEKFKVSIVLINKIRDGHAWNSVTGLPPKRNKKYKTLRYAELG